MANVNLWNNQRSNEQKNTVSKIVFLHVETPLKGRVVKCDVKRKSLLSVKFEEELNSSCLWDWDGKRQQ